MGPFINKAAIEETFTRTSGFYFDVKTGVWQHKDASILVGYYTGPKWQRVAIQKINLAELVEKGEVEKTFKLITDPKYRETFSGIIINATLKVQRSDTSAQNNQDKER